eukprot:TRINITY_DN1518_c0_g1_i1.p1 TRINITY_DN1518_c0_g1~~TRINITY_DN1518_c0_g1_i1.p1  ORF type:complete len:540 (-),score=47.78 TRINITY_DN1518_c0_g1_i1:494-2029(-)
MALPLEASELQMLRDVVGESGELIFAMRCGSWAYNMQTPTSDKDYFGVFIAKYKGPLFGLKSSFDRSGGGPEQADYAIYDVETFCRLLVKGNPKVVEPLFSENRCWYSERWLQIRGCRSLVINLTVARQYFGFATAERRAIKSPATTDISKPTYHAMRLLNEASNILDGRPPQVWLDGEFRDKLMRVRVAGPDCDREQLTEQVEELYRQIEVKLANASIPETIDTKPLTSWLLSIRKAQICDQVSPLSTRVSVPPEFHPMFKEWNNAVALLKQKDFPDGTKIHLCASTGGCSFGLAGSPDTIVLYQAPTEVTLDIFSSFQPIISANETTPKFFSGLVLIEVEEAFRLLVRGHHQIVSIFSSNSSWFSPEMEGLVSQIPVSQISYHSGCVMHCLGVAEGLLSKLATEPEKRLYLSQRLAWQARRALERRDLLPLSLDELNRLQSLRTAPIEKSAAEAFAHSIRQELQSLKLQAKATDLPDKLHPETVQMLNDWLLQRRRDGFQHSSGSETTI